MTDNRFQAVLDEMNAGRLSGGTHWDVIKDALTLASRHAEIEAAEEEMAAAINAISKPVYTEFGCFSATTVRLSDIERAAGTGNEGGE